jgi:cell division protein ZapA
MSNVNLDIGGRSFTVACADGEEAHIAMLGKLIDTKLQTMGGAVGQTETRMLLFAALLLADELHEKNAGTAPASPPAQTATPAIDPGKLETIATRLENLATQLES